MTTSLEIAQTSHDYMDNLGHFLAPSDSKSGHFTSEKVLRAVQDDPAVYSEWIDAYRLMGYQLDDDEQITGVPTPSLVEKTADAFNVDVHIFENDGLINPKDYLLAFAQRRYPIAAGDLHNYMHDISDGHFSGVLLGGPELMEVLQAVSMYALEQGTEERITGGVDEFTTAFRDAIGMSMAQFASFGDAQSSLDYLLKVSEERLDIPADLTINLLERAKARARDLGMSTFEAA